MSEQQVALAEAKLKALEQEVAALAQIKSSSTAAAVEGFGQVGFTFAEQLELLDELRSIREQLMDERRKANIAFRELDEMKSRNQVLKQSNSKYQYQVRQLRATIDRLQPKPDFSSS